MNKTLDKNCQMKDSEIEWIGKIPKGWEVRRFSSCISKSNAGEVIPKEFWGKGCELLYTCAKEPLFSNYEGFPEDKRTQKGNLLLTRNGTPYIHMPKLNSIYSNVVQRVILEKDNSSFIRYTLIQGSKSIIGNGDIIESFNMGKWNSTSIPLPPLYEQQAIANYLDEQIEKIDELIAEQNQAIENWKTYKQSLITEKVTKGLNPGVDMKDSGIEWIGEIPKEWKVIKYKNICNVFAGGTPKTDVQEYWDGDIPWIASGRVQNCLITEPTRYITNLGIINSSTKMLKRGTSVLAMTGATCGNAGFLEIDTCANQSVMAFVPRKNDAFGKFIFYSLMAHRHVILAEQFGGAQAGISTEKGRNLQITLPPLHEQQAISNYLDEKCLKIDQMIEQKQVFIKQLEEYKQSLIYECVTGKRCVL